MRLYWSGGEAYAGVGDSEGDEGVADDGEAAADVDVLRAVLDRVVEQVEQGDAEVFGDAEDVEANCARSRFELDGFGRKVVAAEGDGDAVGDERGKLEEDAVLVALALAELAGLEDLLYGGDETVGVGEHDLVELLALRLGELAALEGFEVEADAGDGGLELVGDGVEEGVLTLVAAELADEEDGVEDDAGDEQGEEDDAEDHVEQVCFVGEDPGDVERDGRADEKHAEHDREGCRSASSGHVHGLGMSIAGRVAERMRYWEWQSFPPNPCCGVTMLSVCGRLSVLGLVLLGAVGLRAQDVAPAEAKAVQGSGSASLPMPQWLPYGGVHEFSVWGGLSWVSGPIWGYRTQVHYAPIDLRYSYLMAAKRHVTVRYAPELTAVAWLDEPIVDLNTNAVLGRKHTFGSGFTPVGFQFDFRPSHRAQPFLAMNGGALYFADRVLSPQGSQFMYTIDFGGGYQIHLQHHRAVTVGYRYQHLSNANISVHNPGTDATTFYVGFSQFHTHGVR